MHPNPHVGYKPKCPPLNKLCFQEKKKSFKKSFKKRRKKIKNVVMSSMELFSNFVSVTMQK